jgi:hypothetical protein
MKTHTDQPELTKEEYVRLELVKALGGKIPWPPNASIGPNLDFLVNLVLCPDKKA